MADGQERARVDDETIVLEAVRQCGVGASDYEVACMAVRLRAKLMRSLDQRNLVARTLGATVIPAVLEDCRLEESSQRFVVTFRPLREGAPSETIRTDRRDSAPHVDQMISSLVMGGRMVVYKTTEAMADGSNHKVRIAPLLLPLAARS